MLHCAKRRSRMLSWFERRRCWFRPAPHGKMDEAVVQERLEKLNAFLQVLISHSVSHHVAVRQSPRLAADPPATAACQCEWATPGCARATLCLHSLWSRMRSTRARAALKAF